jgi:hypothetical protein
MGLSFCQTLFLTHAHPNFHSWKISPTRRVAWDLESGPRLHHSLDLNQITSCGLKPLSIYEMKALAYFRGREVYQYERTPVT